MLDDAGVNVEGHAAGPDHASPKAVAAQHGRHVEHVAANAPAIGHGRQEADVAGQCAQIADMVGHSLQLQRHAAERLSASRNTSSAEGFDGAAVRGGMSGGAVAGERFRIVDACVDGAAQHRPFYAAMLVAQRDFQMVNRLAVALEAKMARLDDAGMNGTDGDFVDLFARHLRRSRSRRTFSVSENEPASATDAPAAERSIARRFRVRTDGLEDSRA